MSVHVTPKHLEIAAEFIAEAKANNGLAPLDTEKFWEAQKIAGKNPWADDCPQVALGVWMSYECLFTELDIEENWYAVRHDEEYRIPHNIKYNDLSEKIVGRRLLNEKKSDPAKKWPETKKLHDIFECTNEWRGDSYWLHSETNTEAKLEALLDRVETRLKNLREFVLPDNWEAEKTRLTKFGCKVPLYRNQRGPITFAMSLYGVENLIFLLMDNRELAARFRDTILRAMLELAKLFDDEASYTPEDAPKGFAFADDNCAMLNAEMYEFFGYPIIKGVFDVYAPDVKHHRYQHSDSDMGHLLPILGKLNFTGCNFGPNLTVTEIREHLPNAIIEGQLAPFTFSRNEEVNIVAEFLRDYEMAKEKKGLRFATAGSINNGSRLTGLRLIMSAIQRYGQY